MNVTSIFLNELQAVDGGAKAERLPQPLFVEAMDEARYNFIKAARRELDALVGIEDHKRRTNYGLKFSGWWEQENSGRFKIVLKDGTNVMELVEGKTYWVLPDHESAIRFLAAAIEAAEKKELDKFLKPKNPSKAKSSDALKIAMAKLNQKRRAEQAANILGDVAVEVGNE